MLVRLVIAAGSGPPFPPAALPVSLAIALNGFVSCCDRATDRQGGTADEEEFGPWLRVPRVPRDVETLPGA